MLRTICQQAVVADGGRRILSAPRMAPTAVGGYWGMKCWGLPVADRVTCCNRCTSDASTRLYLCYVPLAPPVSVRWHPGGGPARLPCSALKMLRLGHLWCNSCIYGLTMKVCDLLVLPLPVLPAVVSRDRLDLFARRGSPSPVRGQTARGSRARVPDGRRDACPTLRKCLGRWAPRGVSYGAAKEDNGSRVEGEKARRRGNSCWRTRNLARNARVFDLRTAEAQS
jgi:hypothetical protein